MKNLNKRDEFRQGDFVFVYSSFSNEQVRVANELTDSSEFTRVANSSTTTGFDFPGFGRLSQLDQTKY